jgi:CheY-like chemotaxis protein
LAVRTRVLVVDDHEDTMLFFVEELAEAGYDVRGTTSPNEALNLAIETKPDVIVMDIAMPEMDGYELARLVRSYAATRGIRLVAVSAHAFDLSARQTPPGGWNAYVGKPVEPGTLAALVRTVMSVEITSGVVPGRLGEPSNRIHRARW